MRVRHASQIMGRESELRKYACPICIRRVNTCEVPDLMCSTFQYVTDTLGIDVVFSRPRPISLQLWKFCNLGRFGLIFCTRECRFLRASRVYVRSRKSCPSQAGARRGDSRAQRTPPVRPLGSSDPHRHGERSRLQSLTLSIEGRS